MLKKNTAGQFIYFVMVKAADGTGHTGLTPTGYVSIDGGVQGGIGGSITETANGQYEYALSQGDTNGDEIGYLFVAAGAIPVNVTVTTETKKMADLNDIPAGAEMDLIADAITASKYDETTAFPVTSADTGASQLARVGADGDTLETISDQIDALPTDADVTVACATSLSNIHLDHLLGVAYSGEGAAGSIYRDLLVDDAGTYQFTTNALENGPSGTGGDATAANQVLILEDLVDVKGTGFVKDTDSLVDLAKPSDIPDAAAINAEVDTALADIHLDHLFAVAYAGEGTAGALLLDLTEDDAGTFRFTTNALEQAPSGTGGDATAANQILLLEDIVDMKGTAFAKDTHSLVDLALASSLAVTDGKIDTIDGVVDAILVDTSTTLDGKINDILTDTGTTIPADIATIDGIVDFIQNVLEGDHVINDAVSPWRLLTKHKTTKATLVEKELFEVDEITDITAVTGVVGAEIEP